MKALVVYESMYGNTAAVGDAIAASLRARGSMSRQAPSRRSTPTRRPRSMSSSSEARPTSTA
jgi:menaquinone-dependent protoporphyrinogen IX oxidase